MAATDQAVKISNIGAFSRRRAMFSALKLAIFGRMLTTKDVIHKVFPCPI